MEAEVTGKKQKTIQNIEDVVNEIQNSVINQNNQIEQVIGESGDYDYFVNTIYQRGQDMFIAIKDVIEYRHNYGWKFKQLSSDYGGMDGVFLIFKLQ